MSSSTFFIEIQHNPPKIINIGQTIDGMELEDLLNLTSIQHRKIYYTNS